MLHHAHTLRLISIWILLLYSIDITNSICPQSELIYPCECYTERMFCGQSNYDLKKIFQSAADNTGESDRHLNLLYLNHSTISELAENVFSCFTFYSIVIDQAYSLTRIHSHAFPQINPYTEYFSVYHTPLDITLTNYNLFDCISTMYNIKYIRLTNTSISSLPNNAFYSATGTHYNLNKIDIFGNQFLKSIGSNVFADMRNLDLIILNYNKIDSIGSHAFSFSGPSMSENILKIDLRDNMLNSNNSIAVDAFDNINRRFSLELANNVGLTYLDERIFGSVLENGNDMYVQAIPFNCDCSMYWIVKRKQQYEKLVIGAKCSDGLWLFDNNRTFENC